MTSTSPQRFPRTSIERRSSRADTCSFAGASGVGSIAAVDDVLVDGERLEMMAWRARDLPGLVGGSRNRTGAFGPYHRASCEPVLSFSSPSASQWLPGAGHAVR
jgi:hypothetical protein